MVWGHSRQFSITFDAIIRNQCWHQKWICLLQQINTLLIQILSHNCPSNMDFLVRHYAVVRRLRTSHWSPISINNDPVAASTVAHVSLENKANYMYSSKTIKGCFLVRKHTTKESSQKWKEEKKRHCHVQLIEPPTPALASLHLLCMHVHKHMCLHALPPPLLLLSPLLKTETHSPYLLSFHYPQSQCRKQTQKSLQRKEKKIKFKNLLRKAD